MNTIVPIDDYYKKWLGELSDRFRSSQIKAAVRVNSEMLQFYWSIGRDIAQMELSAKYGSGFYKKLSFDLKRTSWSYDMRFNFVFVAFHSVTKFL